MKKLLCLFGALSMALTSCSSDDSSDSSNPISESGKLQFDVDGKTITSISVQAIVSDNLISIIGLTSTNGDSVLITIPSNEAGTYNFSNKNLVLAYNTSSDAYGAFLGLSKNDAEDMFGPSDYKDTASITITSIDLDTKKVSGTFQFTAARSGADNEVEIKTISKGSFTDISFTEENIPIKDDSSFSTKLDGTNFVSSNIFATTIMGKISISAGKGTETFSILLPNNIQAGTYTLGDSGLNYSMTYAKGLTPEGLFTAKGTITIVGHDSTKKTINGTFSASFSSYSLPDKHEATEGAFDVTY